MSGHWEGIVAFSPGFGMFKGRAGDNALHRHSAIQLSVSLSDDVIGVNNGNTTRFLESVLVPPNCPHKIAGKNLLSVYVDPATSVGQQLRNQFSSNKPMTLSNEISKQLKHLHKKADTMTECLTLFVQMLSIAGDLAPDPRLKRILNELDSDLAARNVTPLVDMAKLTGLSASRFSHWFKQQTGISLRGYRKWLRLIKGIQHLIEIKDIAIAASEDFSDQAHFSRTLKTTFGVTPKQLLHGISLTGGD